MSKGPEWDRRAEDASVRGEVLKTLGSVQTAIGLFEKSLAEAKARFELKAEKLADKIQEHDEILNGGEYKEGIFQWMHQADRNIKALLMGVLGEEGAHYEKSLKGQLDKIRLDVSAIDTQLLNFKLQLDSLKDQRSQQVTLRGQNILVWVAVISCLGAVLGAALKSAAPKIWSAAVNPPAIEAPHGTPTPAPDWIKPKTKRS